MPAREIKPADAEPADGGITLPEVMTATVLLSCIIVVVVSMVIGSFSMSSTATSRSDSTLAAAQTAELVSRTLRVATIPPGESSAFRRASSDSVEFYASLHRGTGQSSTAPTLIKLDYDRSEGCLRQTTTVARRASAGMSWPKQDAASRCIARISEPPQFEYFVFNGTSSVSMDAPRGGFQPDRRATWASCPRVRAQHINCIVEVAVTMQIASDVRSHAITPSNIKVQLANVRTLTEWPQ